MQIRRPSWILVVQSSHWLVQQTYIHILNLNLKYQINCSINDQIMENMGFPHLNVLYAN
jgi:hypothetical protein